MNKEAIREYFIARKTDFSDIYNIKSRLDAISVFNSDKQLDMKRFFMKITEIMSWELINSIPMCLETGRDQEKLGLAVNLQGWAISAWAEGVKCADISKMITAYTIVERLYLCPCKDLNWNLQSDELEMFIEKSMKCIRLDIELDALPKDISYRDLKIHRVYREALDSKNYSKIIEFLWNNGFIINLERNPSYYFLKILIQVAMIYHRFLIDNFSNYSPVLLKTIFMNISVSQIILLLKDYKGNDPLPLLIGLIQIVNPDGANMLRQELTADDTILRGGAEIVEKISNLVTTENIFSFITNCSNIERNKLWHSIFVTFAARNYNYSRLYIDSVNIFDNVQDLGMNSFDILKRFCASDDIEKISMHVYKKCLEELNKLNHGHYFRFTSYLKYIFCSVFVLSNNSFTKYLELLEQKSLNLQRAIYSWNIGELHKYFTDWFYWIISAKLFPSRQIIDKNLMSRTYSLLNDKRLLNKLKCDINGQHISFDKLIDFLDNPDNIKSVLVPHNNDIVEIHMENL